MNPKIKERITESILIKQQLLEDQTLLETIDKIANLTTIALKGGKKILFCGNGGSAADAQHLATELSGRYYLDRKALNAEALHVNSSFVTAVANDYGFEKVFARSIQAKGENGDILFALSTSGNSPNILEAIEEARRQFMIVVGMTGLTGGKMGSRCDYLIKIPSIDTPRIQEGHILIGHLLCEIVEASIFGKPTF